VELPDHLGRTGAGIAEDAVCGQDLVEFLRRCSVMAESLLDRMIRRQGWMERWGDAIQGAVGGIYGALGAPGRSLKNLLHGTTLLGHPLHPAITDVPIGAWTVGVIADYVAHFTDRLPTQAGDVALAVGLVTALLAVMTGYTDFHATFGHERRVALLHGLVNTVVVVLMAVSLALRWWAGPGLHPVAVGLATAGWVLVIFGGYLGGHLVFGSGTMVNRSAFLDGFEGSAEVGASTDFPEGELRRVDARGMPVLLVRRGGQLLAISNTCSHAGGPLDEGSLDGTVVTCPWHGSRFDVRTGRVCGGPATFSQPALHVVEAGGRVSVALAEPLH
jgi:nitrite reductase/ring-hydroxylating ferredoxin subunit/uncharacterized membrane protein